MGGIHITDRRTIYFAKKVAGLKGESIKNVIREAMREAARTAKEDAYNRAYRRKMIGMMADQRSAYRGFKHLCLADETSFERSWHQSARAKIENSIDALVDLLDELDDLDDRELDADFEPSLAGDPDHPVYGPDLEQA